MIFMFFKQSLMPSKQHTESPLALSSVSAWDGLYDHIGHAERPDRSVILKTWHRWWGQSYFHLVSVGRVSSCSVCRLACALVFHKFPERQNPKQSTGHKGRRGTGTQAIQPPAWQGAGRWGNSRSDLTMSRENESKKNLKLLLANTLR